MRVAEDRAEANAHPAADGCRPKLQYSQSKGTIKHQEVRMRIPADFDRYKSDGRVIDIDRTNSDL